MAHRKTTLNSFAALFVLKVQASGTTFVDLIDFYSEFSLCGDTLLPIGCI